jgi:hypothetical protein
LAAAGLRGPAGVVAAAGGGGGGPTSWGELPSANLPLGGADGSAFLFAAEDYGMAGADYLFGGASGSSDEHSSGSSRPGATDSSSLGGSGSRSGGGDADVEDAVDDAFEDFLACVEGRAAARGFSGAWFAVRGGAAVVRSEVSHVTH